ncbi:hypothetical protein [Sporanaerobacter acetigenes]|uniref:Type IV secretion system protein VirD4 n=1 Tax=Sporanaerobacter acetigenes DSM 13106 TaxID=1123281 RepID=A0A1M5U8P0_9FIRM|nr:hypothetical protein [Sporanaerobacter acetigenes]SHH59425.1 type IV secretion system protein VirD4 [Sporanaerobacter acetigenes DSM 13106]
MSKQKKFKIGVSILILILGTIGSIYFSVYLDTLLSKGKIDIHIFKIQKSFEIIKNSRNALKLLGCFELLLIIMNFIYFFSNDRAYESDLIQITPAISIPVPAGQKQHGSARFMTEKEKEKAFTILEIKQDKEIKNLLKYGYDDLKNMKGGDENRISSRNC